MPSFCRRRTRRVGVAVLAAALLAGCSGGGEPAGKGAGPGAPATPTTVEGAVAFALTGADVHAIAPRPPPFPEDVKAAVKAVLDAYLDRAVVAPLRTGRPSGGLEAVFSGAALARLSAPGPDRAALLEEGDLEGRVRSERADAKLTALTDPGGQVAVVAAQLEIVLRVARDGGAVSVARTGEVVLVPEAGGWRIDAYDVRTARDSVPGGR